jgi:radical SAM superfamily enzyme YgiQ (UPF0313 family)
MYNVIFFSDTSSAAQFGRSYGTHKLATELRKQGHTVLCVNFCNTLTFEMYEKILDLAVGPETYFIGFSTTWFIFRDIEMASNVAKHSMAREYYPDRHPWFLEGLSWNFIQDTTPFAQAIKKRNPNTKIILGGPKINEYKDDPNIDYLFDGYAESMLLDFAASISKKGPRRIFNRVIDYDKSSESIFQSSYVEYTEDDIMMENEVVNIEFSRGCVFSCSFCNYPLIGKKNLADHLKYKETLRTELMNNYTKWGITKYNIVDDTFNDTVYKLQLIKEVIDTLPFKPKFWCYCRIDLLAAHPEMAQLMLDIGVTEVFWGAETFNNEAGKAIKKGNTNKKFEGLKIAHEVWKDKVFIFASFIVGLPKEDKASILNTINWYLDEGHQYIQQISMVPLTFLSWISPSITDMSVFDKEYEKYGYKKPDINSETPPWVWFKDDGTDIKSMDDANELVKDNLQQCIDKASMNRNRIDFYPIYGFADSRLLPENLDNLSSLEISEIDGKLDVPNVYKEFIDTFYWPRLFKRLQYKNKIQHYKKIIQ